MMHPEILTAEAEPLKPRPRILAVDDDDRNLLAVREVL